MLSQDEAVLLEHLGQTEEEARRNQEEDKYGHLLDYLATACRQKDRAEFQELIKRIEDKFRSIKEFQPAWNFMERVKQAVSNLEK